MRSASPSKFFIQTIRALLACSVLILMACNKPVEPLSGTYFSQNKQASLEFTADGSCVLRRDGKEYRGTVQQNDQGVTLQLGIDLSLQMQRKDDALIEANGNRWSK